MEMGGNFGQILELGGGLLLRDGEYVVEQGYENFLSLRTWLFNQYFTSLVLLSINDQTQFIIEFNIFDKIKLM